MLPMYVYINFDNLMKKYPDQTSCVLSVVADAKSLNDKNYLEVLHMNGNIGWTRLKRLQSSSVGFVRPLSLQEETY